MYQGRDGEELRHPFCISGQNRRITDDEEQNKEDTICDSYESIDEKEE